jgi:hypothetical protein
MLAEGVIEKGKGKMKTKAKINNWVVKRIEERRIRKADKWIKSNRPTPIPWCGIAIEHNDCKFKTGNKVVALYTSDHEKIVSGIVYIVSSSGRVYDPYEKKYFYDVIHIKGIHEEVSPDSFRLATSEEIKISNKRLSKLMMGKGDFDFNPYLEVHRLELLAEERDNNRELYEDIIHPKGPGNEQDKQQDTKTERLYKNMTNYEEAPFKTGDKIVALDTFDDVPIVKGTVYTVKKVVTRHHKSIQCYTYKETFIENVHKAIPVVSFRIATSEETRTSKEKLRILSKARDGTHNPGT